MAGGYCSLCGHAYRSWAEHFGSKEHQRNMHPTGSRKGTRANARRDRRRVERKRFGSARAYERDQDRHFAELQREERRERREAQGPRHFYGRWTPYGVSAFMGGHPGRAIRKAHRHVRRHIRRLMSDE